MLNVKNFSATATAFFLVFKGSATLHARHFVEDDAIIKSVSKYYPSMTQNEFLLDSTKVKAAQGVEKIELKPLSPLITQRNGRDVIDPAFVNNVPVYAEMADLSYHLVKGNNPLSTKSMEKFMKEGWKVTGFGGFSGNQDFDKENYEAKNRDLGGFVAFNSKTDEAVVCFHGSQDNYDWQNNFDAKKMSAREANMNFDGDIQRGFAGRYNSSREDIYTLLTRLYEGLDNRSKQKFHITTTGHSLGAGMATIGYADLSTQFAQKLWGKEYKNITENRVRGYVMSPPRAFDEKAVENLTPTAGIQNIIIDTNDKDPVSKVGPGRTVTKWLESSSSYGPTGLLLKVAKFFGVLDTSHPQEVAKTYGGYRHLGRQATQDTAETIKRAQALPLDPALAEVEQKQGFFKRWTNKIKGYFAPVHYGNRLAQGVAFDPRLIQPETLEARINATKPK